MISRKQCLKAIIATSFLVLALCSCAELLRENVEIKGVVRLSDNPPIGHGGVIISNGFIETTSAVDGSFAISKGILRDAAFTLTIEKPGYQTMAIECSFSYSSTKDKHDGKPAEILDLGTIVLPKL